MSFISKYFPEKFKKRIKQQFFKKKLALRILEELQIKLSLSDQIFRFDNVKFYVPNYPLEAIQKTIVNQGNFYESDILNKIDQYMPENARILDIGANIGNHSIYWAIKSNAKKIVAFEPIEETFKILQRNIEINHLNSVITAHNVALGEKSSMASIQSFSFENHGATSLMYNENGNIPVRSLDDLIDKNDIFDFVKIDVEGFEEGVLNGAKETLLKNKPYLFIEIHISNYNQIIRILERYNAKLICKFDQYNYLFKLN